MRTKQIFFLTPLFFIISIFAQKNAEKSREILRQTNFIKYDRSPTWKIKFNDKSKNFQNVNYLSEVSILEAADIISKKFKEGKIEDLIINERIKVKSMASDNLFKSTLKIKDAKEVYVLDNDSKFFRVVVDETEDADKIEKKFYNYLDKFRNWTEKKGDYELIVSHYSKNVRFESDDFTIELDLSLNRLTKNLVFLVTFSE